MQIIIISSNFYNFQENKVEIGGLQTYVRDLAALCTSQGFDVTIVQLNARFADGDERMSGGVRIINRVPKKGNQQKVFNAVAKKYPQAFYILATDQLRIRLRRVNGLQIQHGIAFDIPGHMIGGFWGKTNTLQFVNKLLRCIKNVKRFYQAYHTVCVDYNYYNWFRTLGTIRAGQRITVIPNYANEALTTDELENKLERFRGVREIVFARRFVDYRGTLMFANIIPGLLDAHPHVRVTLAGQGPLEPELHRRFDGNSRVRFATFDSAKSLDFHRNFDLAIVPTIFSEGTSLSLCEAMAAGCLPICTHVGGMTNIVLDEFNGYMTYPSEESLAEAIDTVMALPYQDYKQMVRNAYATATTTFSRAHWAGAWVKVLNNYR